MRENEKLEEIFDRYAGLELLNRDRTEATWLPASGTGRDLAAAWEFSPDFFGEPLLQGVAGST
jgi:hypothetical protein